MAEKRIALLTDSTCDIPENLIEQYSITVIPQVIIWGDQALRDRIDISPQQFYERLRSDQRTPSTTQPSPADFERAYQDVIAQGAEQLLVFTVSSAMSGTFQLAKRVAGQMKVLITVVDSKGPTMSLGWQVLAAARAGQAGASLDEMVDAATCVREKLVQIVCLDTLEFLQRGGRIGSATRLVGSLLDIKPLVQINHQTGLVESAGQARTRKKSIALLLQRFFEQITPNKPLHVAVLHGNAPEEAAEIAARIQEEYAPQELLINITGPVLGVNTGPRALALAGYTEV